MQKASTTHILRMGRGSEAFEARVLLMGQQVVISSQWPPSTLADLDSSLNVTSLTKKDHHLGALGALNSSGAYSINFKLTFTQRKQVIKSLSLIIWNGHENSIKNLRMTLHSGGKPVSCFCKMTIKYVKCLLLITVIMVLQYLLWLLVGGELRHLYNLKK